MPPKTKTKHAKSPMASASCPVGDLSSTRVVQSASWQSANWRIRELSSNLSTHGTNASPATRPPHVAARSVRRVRSSRTGNATDQVRPSATRPSVAAPPTAADNRNFARALSADILSIALAHLPSVRPDARIRTDALAPFTIGRRPPGVCRLPRRRRLVA